MDNINYKGLETLEKTEDNIRRIYHDVEKINLCIFNINKMAKEPYLEYLLYKCDEKCGDQLYFPWFKYSVKDIYDKEKSVKETLFDIAKQKAENIFSNFENTKIVFKGSKHKGKELFLFFQVVHFNFSVKFANTYFSQNKITRKRKFIFCTLGEIVNTKMVNNKVEWLYLNKDGSLVEFCGNASRCIIKYLIDKI